ncbi:MAG: DUF4401 domain-containing protein [Flavobacteriaceae bacterium]|jgi:hypothetical protein|nr:DUF4401 domain-containing protein [Flavobacteriaceae bacterium]
MNTIDDIKKTLDRIKVAEGDSFQYDEEAILNEYRNKEYSGLGVRILTIFGGFMAMFFFWGFLALMNVFRYELVTLILGILSIFGAIALSKIYNKLIIDTLSVFLFITGFLLVGIYYFSDDWEIVIASVSGLCLIFIFFAIITLLISENYMLVFLSVLTVNGSVLTLLHDNKWGEIIYIYLSLLVVFTTFFYLKEAKIITYNKKVSKLYNPISVGLIISLIAGFIFVNVFDEYAVEMIDVSSINIYSYILGASFLFSIICIGAILYTNSIILKKIGVENKKDKVIIYILITLFLLPTMISIGISGSLLIILLCFLVNYKTGFAIGVIAFVYFIGQLYYDLSFTLLVKSGLMISSGIIFLSLYFFTSKKLRSNEKG